MKLRHGLFIVLAGCSSSSAAAPSPGPDASSEVSDDASSAVDGAASTSDAAATGATDSATTGAEASDDGGTDAAPPCNTLANTAPAVDVTQVAANPPVPQGGTIVDGTYWQTSLQIYTGPNGPTGTTGTSQSTALIQGTTVQLVASGTPARRTITLTTADAGFTSVDTCPDTTMMSQGGYTATSTSLVIFLPGGTDDAGARTVLETLTKQ